MTFDLAACSLFWDLTFDKFLDFLDTPAFIAAEEHKAERFVDMAVLLVVSLTTFSVK